MVGLSTINLKITKLIVFYIFTFLNGMGVTNAMISLLHDDYFKEVHQFYLLS